MNAGSQVANLLGSLFQMIDQSKKSQQARDTWSQFQGRLAPAVVPEPANEFAFPGKMPIPVPGVELPVSQPVAQGPVTSGRRPVTEDDLMWLMGAMPQGHGSQYVDMANAMYRNDADRAIAEQKAQADYLKALFGQQKEQQQLQQQMTGNLLSGLFGLVNRDQQINPAWGTLEDAVNTILQTGQFPQSRTGTERRTVDPRTTPTLTGYEDVQSQIPLLVPDPQREKYTPAGTFTAGGETFGTTFNTNTGEYATQLLNSLRGAQRIGQEKTAGGGRGGRGGGSKPLSLNEQQEKATLEAQLAVIKDEKKRIEEGLKKPSPTMDPNYKLDLETKLRETADKERILKGRYSVYASPPAVNTPQEQSSRSSQPTTNRWWK